MLSQAHDTQSSSLRNNRARALAKPSKEELELIADLARFAWDPAGFVRYAFPWRVAGSRLESEAGPDIWQQAVLDQLGKDVAAGIMPGHAASNAIQYAVVSGHGVGKSALVAWVILWLISCFDFPQIVVTANTRSQLLTKTWRELAKWHRMSINSHWFEWTATSLKHLAYPDTWFASAIPWSASNSEAFAGTHEQVVLVIFDEASGIDDKIWEVIEGAMSGPLAIWLAFGNPTKNTGRFRECFGRLKHRWRTWHVDSRDAKLTNKERIQQAIDDYGEDSDLVRVRWRGVFPRAGSTQLISSERVLEAMKRPPYKIAEDAAKILGVDVARHGDDQSCSLLRQALNVTYIKRRRIPDLMQLTMMIAEEIDTLEPDAVVVDVTGMGWGVYDWLTKMRPNTPIYPIQVGETALDERKYWNRRSEIWWKMRQWFETAPSIPNDVELEQDLTGIEYGYDVKERVQLESKDDMKERGLASPDSGDALALTFSVAVTVARKPKHAMLLAKLRKLQNNNPTGTTPQSA